MELWYSLPNRLNFLELIGLAIGLIFWLNIFNQYLNVTKKKKYRFR